MVRVGSIIVIDNPTNSKTETKTGIVVAVGSIFVVLVNTENRQMYECVPIFVRDHAFLGQDRFVGCRAQFEIAPGNVKKIRGHATKADLERILAQINKSRTISAVRKQWLNESLLPAIAAL